MVHALSHKRDYLSLVDEGRLWRFLYAFGAELGIICGGAIKFGLVPIIVTAHSSTGPLDLNVERDIALIVFGLVVKG